MFHIAFIVFKVLEQEVPSITREEKSPGVDVTSLETGNNWQS